APVASMGRPRELNTMQAVPAIVPPVLLKQGGDCAITACVFGGGTAVEPKLKMPVPASAGVGPSGTQVLVVRFHSSTGKFRLAIETLRRVWLKLDAARIFAVATEFRTLRASPVSR